MLICQLALQGVLEVCWNWDRQGCNMSVHRGVLCHGACRRGFVVVPLMCTLGSVISEGCQMSLWDYSLSLSSWTESSLQVPLSSQTRALSLVPLRVIFPHSCWALMWLCSCSLSVSLFRLGVPWGQGRWLLQLQCLAHVNTHEMCWMLVLRIPRPFYNILNIFVQREFCFIR